MARRKVVILTFDPSVEGFWLTDYFPEIPEIDAHSMPPIPRPEAYLDAEVRSAISLFAKLPDVERGVAALRRDLASGAWQRRYGELLERDTLDLGYRLVIA